MAGGYVVPPAGEFAELRRLLTALERRVRILEAPTGSQIAETLATLRMLVEDLVDTVNALAASGVTWEGPVSTTGNISTSAGFVFTPAGYGFDITYTRRGAWLGNDGRLGYASSSREKKTNIRDAEIDPRSVLAIVPRIFQYRAELEKQATDPTYHVAEEFGAIAEELHELGLWQVVIYEWDTVQEFEPVFDESGLPVIDESTGNALTRPVGQPLRVGEPRPVGIHYEMLGLLAIEAAKHLDHRVAAVEDRLTAAGL